MKKSFWFRTVSILFLLSILIGVWYFNVPYSDIIVPILMLGSVGVAFIGSSIDKKEKQI
ncbi:hypothetical protein [Weissella bombi]|uniref:Uncharacterized protein n=1 Tax=Weissella bombi TaxID=1505725 RepID=A0A1C4B850_9LACO|nr:hypothetical protein [Weissella bombi]SCC03085.1 hypothetical protein GA0061074_10936 [Weissella bombi]